MRRSLAGLSAAALAVFVLVGCSSGGGSSSDGTTSAKSAAKAASARPSPGKLGDLESVEQLRSLFNADSGRPRLIVLASPT